MAISISTMQTDWRVHRTNNLMSTPKKASIIIIKIERWRNYDPRVIKNNYKTHGPISMDKVYLDPDTSK